MATLFNLELKERDWRSLALLTLGFWLSGSVLLDLVIMPVLYTTGMMSDANFATTGYTLFNVFNHIEVFCAALVLTIMLVFRYLHVQVATKLARWENWSVSLAIGLLGVALLFTYLLTPQMGAMGIQLNLFQAAVETPAGMNQLHGIYWALEVLKLIGGGALLGLLYRHDR
ncbi:DUF4149 domain-containing protein [Trichothermofontia sp.]